MTTRSLLAILFIAVFLYASVQAQLTEFTYQGRLLDNALPPTANYDFQFSLWDALANGTQQGTTQTLTGVAVANGIFTVKLDFGAQFTGAARFLQIEMRPAGGGAYTTLAPRQPITSSPHAIRSLNAANADTATIAGNVTGVVAAANGGTGSNTSGAPRGSILYKNLSGTWVSLPPGAAGEVLRTNGVGADPSWQPNATLTANSFQISWVSGISFASGSWATIPASSTTFVTTGKPLLITMNLSLNGGSHAGCRPIIDGVWAGAYGGLIGGGDPFWQEGLTAVGAAGAGWQRWEPSRIYPGVPVGSHSFSIQCATDAGALTVCGGSIGCSWGAFELH